MKHVALALILVVCAAVGSADPPARAAKPVAVPYRLTETQHIMVRAKFNGKGPFNFIVDTGAPAMFTSTAVARKAGLEVDKQGWAAIDRLHLEGGLIVENTKTRVDDLFQLKGVNGLGLAGVELHGVIGYNVLATGRIEFDLTKDHLLWTPLDYKPLPVGGMGGKGGAPGGLDALGASMQFLGGMLGLKPATPPVARGFLGIEVEANEDAVVISKVYTGSPASQAQLRVGDRIVAVNGKDIKNLDDLKKVLNSTIAGAKVEFQVQPPGNANALTKTATLAEGA